VTKVTNKTFVGKDIIYVAIFKKNDDRTIYNMIYRDNITNKSYIKRFAVKGVTRDRQYLLVNSEKSLVLYFTANPNGEAEIVSVILRAKSKLKKLKLEVDFSKYLIKNRMVKGNLITSHSINKVELKSEGLSTLSGKKIWFDQSIFRLNDESRGDYLGEFSADDKLVVISSSGYLELFSYDLSNHFPEDLVLLEKYSPTNPINLIYFHGDKKQFYIKRFIPPLKSKKQSIIHPSKGSYLELAYSGLNTSLRLEFIKPRNRNSRKDEVIKPEDLISVKGISVLGNQLSRHPIKNISILKTEEKEDLIDNKEEVLDNNDNQMKMNF